MPGRAPLAIPFAGKVAHVTAVEPAEGMCSVLKEKMAEFGRENIDIVQKLANVQLELRSGPAPRGEGPLRSTAVFDLVLRAPMAQVEAQRKRLEKEIEQLEKVIAGSGRQLGDQKFLSRAPAAVVDGIRQKLTDYEAQLAKSRSALESLPQA